MTITGLDLIGCTVSNLERSLTFYRDTLDLQPSFLDSRGAEFEFPNGETFAIWKPDYGDHPVGAGVMFTVSDAEAVAGRIAGRGAQLSGLIESPVCKMVFGEDPDGNRFCLHQRTQRNDPVPPPHRQSATSVNAADWAGYFVSDPEKSLAFYRDIVGLTPTEIAPGSGVDFKLSDGTTFGILRGSHEPSRGGTFMFTVDNLDAKAAELRARGVDLPTPRASAAWSTVYLQDPDSITFAIRARI